MLRSQVWFAIFSEIETDFGWVATEVTCEHPANRAACSNEAIPVSFKMVALSTSALRIIEETVQFIERITSPIAG